MVDKGRMSRLRKEVLRGRDGGRVGWGVRVRNEVFSESLFCVGYLVYIIFFVVCILNGAFRF